MLAMGLIIDTWKMGTEYDKNANSVEDFATDETGRLVPRSGEVFEIMPLGSLDVLAFVRVKDTFHQNNHTRLGMQWEIGFSEERISFFSPDTTTPLGGFSKRQGHVTMGFNYFNELRSISLGSAQEEGGPYISLVFMVDASHQAQVPVGVRMHGQPQNLHIFATVFAAHVVKAYSLMAAELNVDISDLNTFFDCVNGYDYAQGRQTDLYISATQNKLEVSEDWPLSASEGPKKPN